MRGSFHTGTHSVSVRSFAQNEQSPSVCCFDQGDLNKKLKKNQTLEMQIKKMSSSCDKVDPKHKKDIAELEEDIQKITTNVQVGAQTVCVNL